MRILCALLLAAVAAAQTNLVTPVTVLPRSDHSDTGELRFRDQQTSPHYIGFKAPASIGSNQIWIWPDSDGVGCLTSDGAGNLSFASCGGGGGTAMTTNTAQTVTSGGVKTWNANILTNGTVDFGTHASPWLHGYFNNLEGQAVTISDLTVTNSCTGCTGGLPTNIMTLNTAQTVTSAGIKTFQADIRASGAPDIGTKSNTFHSLFLNGVLATHSVELYNTSDADDNGNHWNLTSTQNLLNNYVTLSDDIGGTFMTFSKTINGVPYAAVETHADLNPGEFGRNIGNGPNPWTNLFMQGEFRMGGNLVMDANRNTHVNNLTIDGTCTGCGGGGGGSFLPLAGGTMTGDINVSTNGVRNIGSKSNPWALITSNIMAAKSHEVYGSSASDLNDVHWSISGNITASGALSSEMNFFDTAGNQALSLSARHNGTPLNSAVFQLHVSPFVANTFDLGAITTAWRNLYMQSGIYMGGNQVMDSGRNVHINNLQLDGTCTGCGGGGGAVTSVTGNAPISTFPSTGAVAISCTDCMTLSTIQTVAGTKTFTGSPGIVANNAINANSFVISNGASPTPYMINNAGDFRVNTVYSVSGFRTVIDSSGAFVGSSINIGSNPLTAGTGSFSTLNTSSVGTFNVGNGNLILHAGSGSCFGQADGTFFYESSTDRLIVCRSGSPMVH